MHIELYTDGSATTAEKPGGYGWVVVINQKKYFEGSGHMEKASNNDAELEAALTGLIAVKNYIDERLIFRYPKITLVSDSQLVLGWANGSYKFRQQNKMDKFKQLQLLVNLMSVRTRWVEGHSGDEHNERCDALANAARLEKHVDIPIDITDKSTHSPFIIEITYLGKRKIIDLENNTVVDYTEKY